MNRPYAITPDGLVLPGMSFTYDGNPVTIRCPEGDALPGQNAVRHTLPDGLTVTTRIRRFPSGAVWWVNEWANPTDHDSGLIENICDCDVTLPFTADDVGIPAGRLARQRAWEHPGELLLYTVNGANVHDDDYAAVPHLLPVGKSFEAATAGGRSCLGTAPYFDITKDGRGALIAVGWTGQWRAWFDRDEDSVRVRTGLEEMHFRMRPGERFRTGSAVLLPYDNGQDDAHNRFRAFMRDISPLGGKGRGEDAPFSAIFWGGVTTGQLLDRWQRIFDAGLPFDTCWIDAGWYEPLNAPDRVGQVRTWQQLGMWEVSRAYHPDGYRSVVDALSAHGVGLMVWFEPERLNKTTKEWVRTLRDPDRVTDYAVVALNEDEVCDAVIGMVSRKVDELSLSVYRQDFNANPLGFWRANDEEGRRGITELRYINNLYRFWDTLLARHPHLLIDNCSSGGMRNDVEMLSRSVPLWRSDYSCAWDMLPEGNQIHNAGAAWWMPYSGIGFGPTLGDTYAFRSAYAPGLTVRTWEHADPPFEVGAMNEPLDWAKQYFDEYVSVRRYFSRDYYQLLPISLENTTWSASQYHDPADDTGIVLAFRRALSPFPSAVLSLGGLDPEKTYRFTDADTGDTFLLPGAQAGNAVFTVPEKRQAKLWRYEPVPADN